MTRDDIIRMAKEAGWSRTGRNPETGPEFPVLVDRLERFAAFVAAAERKACVNLAEDLIRHFENKKISRDPLGGTREIYAIRKYQDMIHARGEA